jgi:two-component system sensor histidine kinase UhpB
MPLFWRVSLTNALVFLVGTLVLALSPATVSTRVLASEAAVLAVGFAVILLLNAALLRSLLVPLDRLTRMMREVDLRSPGLRLRGADHGPAGDLVAGFNDMIHRLEEERGASTAKALAAQEDERRRIAQELHDEVGQSLTVVLLGLRQARDRAEALDPGLAELLASTQETTRSSLEEVRRIAQRLRPGMLEDLGLLASLSSLASDAVQRAGIEVTRAFAPGLPPLDPATELVVYRVAQEALTNVVRHADASHVEVGLSRQGSSLVLRVVDDGRGIGRSPVEGAGIQGMRERANLVGGTLALRDVEGGGTEVRLVVKVAEP